MNEPKRPSYLPKELEIMKLKTNEYNRLRNDANEIQQFINNNLSNRSINIKKKESVISFLKDKLPLFICIFISVIIALILVNNGYYKTTEKKVTTFLYYFFVICLAGFPIICIIAGFIMLPFSSVFSKVFNSSFEELHNEEDRLRNEYQSNLVQKYSKYLVIQKELEEYKVELKKYQEFCLRSEKEFWYSLDGHQFENEVAKIFRKEGFDTKVSRVGADGGVDIVVSKNNKRYAVQCKAHTSKVSESVARDLYGVLHSRNFDGGYLVTLNGTSSKTKEFCKKNRDKPIIIWTIYDILKKYK